MDGRQLHCFLTRHLGQGVLPSFMVLSVFGAINVRFWADSGGSRSPTLISYSARPCSSRDMDHDHYAVHDGCETLVQ